MVYEAGNNDFIKSIVGEDNITEFTKLIMTCGINKIKLGNIVKTKIAAFQLYKTKISDGDLFDLDNLDDDTIIFLSPKSIIDMLDIIANMLDMLVAAKIISEVSKTTFIDKFIEMGNKNALIKYSKFKDYLEDSTMSFHSKYFETADDKEFYNKFDSLITKIPFLRGNAIDLLLDEAREDNKDAESSNEG